MALQPPTPDHVAEALAASIRNGTLMPGQTFPSERDLCDRFGVGRNTVRSAITNLQSMGLVDQEFGCRPRVAAPTLGKFLAGVGDAARHLFSETEGRAYLEQARLFLELSLVRYAVTHATHAHIAAMIEAIKEGEAGLGERAAFCNADVRFHRVLAEIPGNPIFVALHEAFVERLMNERTVPSDFDSYIRRSHNEHKELVGAMLDKDVDRAEKIMTEHLARTFASHFRDALAGSET